jgi:hypothetical protein
LATVQLWCGGTSAEERRCEVVDELLLTKELLRDLRTVDKER